jgi:hypothetical protein
MCKKMIYLVCFVSVLVLNGSSLGELIGYWTFDDPTNLGADSSGKGNHGTVEGDAQFSSNALIGTGALMLDGTDDYIRVGLGSGNMLANWTSDLTIAAWMKPDNASRQWNCFFGHTTENNGVKFELMAGNFRFTTLAVQDYDLTVSPPFQSGEWAHVALTFSKQYLATFYANGKRVGQITGSAPAGTATGNYNIGYGGYWAAEQFQGLLDDVRIYNHTLSEAEIQVLAFRPKAYKPSPPDGATGVAQPLLQWTAGSSAAFHDVYFGTDPDAPEFQAHYGRLQTVYYHGLGITPGTTYYWRIDEVEADGTTVYKGDVWSFTAAPLKAWNPNPPDGARFVDPNADLSWNAGAAGITRDVYFGTDETAVTNGTGDTFKVSQVQKTYDPGTLALETTYYWRIDEIEGGGKKHKGDVWSFTTIPMIPIIDPNLVGWWKLDEGEGSTVVDWSSHGNHGTFVGNPQWVPGYDGGALELDGSSWVDYGNPPQSQITQAITIACWINPAAISGDRGFVARDGAYALKSSDDHLRFTTPGILDHDGLNTILVAQTWQHIAVTFLSGQTRGLVFYLNGVETERLDSSAMNAGTGPLRVGNNQWSQTYAGLIDDVRLYNKVLTQQEIKQAMRGDPLLAWDPSPANGYTPDIDGATPLSWNGGDKAVQHDVYLATDQIAVRDADKSDTTGVYRGRQSAASYTPGEALVWGQTYYWRIDEYNTDGTISTGRVWTFTVANYLIPDDFEDYDDYCNRIFYKWTDGWGYSADPTCAVTAYGGNGTGSTVGNLSAPFAEQSIVHGGAQSMPFEYDNSGTAGKARYSETQRQWASPQDWTKGDVKALTLYFYGDPANAAEQFYVALEDNGGQVRVANHPDPGAIQAAAWQEWNIPLTDFAGVNLKAIKKMYIGFGNRVSPTAGGSGKLYIDDIRVYPSRCVPSKGKPAADLSGNCIVDYADVEIMTDQWLDSGFVVTPVDPGTTGLIAHYPFNGNANDVVGAYNGTTAGLPVYATGKIGQAIQLDGVDDMVTVGAVGISGAAARTIAGWSKANATAASLPDWINIFGFVGPQADPRTNMSFDIELVNVGGNRGYGIHVYGWERVIMPIDLDWHYLAASYDGTTIRWYGDGRLIGSDSTRVLNTRNQVHMGKRDDNANYWPGRVDEVRIYSRVLSEAQVAWLAGYTSPFSIAADLNVDDVINLKDFAVLADAWLDQLFWP